jgi:mannose-6-phosphate isomerase-like protein (cupin superfamily)
MLKSPPSGWPFTLTHQGPDVRQAYKDVTPYITKDGSEIRELMHPSVQGNKQQSLAEATVPVGGKTLLHKHTITEELYHITRGRGLMTLGDKSFEVIINDTVCIPPGTAHCIKNLGEEPLVLLCCCSPAYAHDDTALID